MNPAVSASILCVLSCIAAFVFIKGVLPAYRKEILVRLSRSFARAIELRAGSHYGLSQQVASLGKRVAKELGLTDPQIHRLEVSAYLRDIGLSAVPYKVLNKVDDWTPADESVYRRHPEVGGAMLEIIPALAPFSRVVRHHHDSLQTGAETPMESRIIATVADYCWLERRGEPEDALSQIEQRSGVVYDPRVVEALKTVIIL